jgi:hypothetical protein
MTISRFVVTANTTIAWPAIWSEVVSGCAAVPVTAPSVPGSTVAVFNSAGVSVLVVVTGATVSAVTINGTLAGSGAGSYVVPFPGGIALTYSSGSPSWTWSAAELPQSGSSSMTAAAGATAPPGGLAGSVPFWSCLFPAGTTIFADSSGPAVPPTGPQALYQAIGSANLRAFVDGNDTIGHAALAN